MGVAYGEMAFALCRWLHQMIESHWRLCGERERSNVNCKLECVDHECIKKGTLTSGASTIDFMLSPMATSMRPQYGRYSTIVLPGRRNNQAHKLALVGASDRATHKTEALCLHFPSDLVLALAVVILGVRGRVSRYKLL